MDCYDIILRATIIINGVHVRRIEVCHATDKETTITVILFVVVPRSQVLVFMQYYRRLDKRVTVNCLDDISSVTLRTVLSPGHCCVGLTFLSLLSTLWVYQSEICCGTTPFWQFYNTISSRSTFTLCDTGFYYNL